MDRVVEDFILGPIGSLDVLRHLDVIKGNGLQESNLDLRKVSTFHHIRVIKWRTAYGGWYGCPCPEAQSHDKPFIKKMPVFRPPGMHDDSTNASGLYNVKMGQVYPHQTWTMGITWPQGGGVGCYHPSVRITNVDIIRAILREENKTSHEKLILLTLIDEQFYRSRGEKNPYNGDIGSLMHVSGQLKTAYQVLRQANEFMAPRRSAAAALSQWGAAPRRRVDQDTNQEELE
jgi:hypothetical protein